MIEGRAQVEIDGKASEVEARNHVHIPLQAHHRLTNIGVTDLVILELQQGDILDENDIVRIEDDYCRN